MKAFVAFAITCLVASAFTVEIELTEEQKTKSQVHLDECIKLENISKEDETKVRNLDFNDASPGMKCFSACFLEKMGAIKDNVVQEDFILKEFSPIFGQEKLETALEKCKNIKEADRCELTYKRLECVYNVLHEK